MSRRSTWNGNSWERQSFINRYFYWILFVPSVAALIFTVFQLKHDLTPVPAAASHIGRYWKVDDPDSTYPAYNYYEYDGERIAAIYSSPYHSYFKVSLLCHYDVLHTKSDPEYDTLENAEQYAERTCKEYEDE